MLTGTTKVYNVFYGDWQSGKNVNSNSGAVSVIDNFIAYIDTTPWFNILTQTYKDTDGTSPTKLNLVGHFFVNTTN